MRLFLYLWRVVSSSRVLINSNMDTEEQKLVLEGGVGVLQDISLRGETSHLLDDDEYCIVDACDCDFIDRDRNSEKTARD